MATQIIHFQPNRLHCDPPCQAVAETAETSDVDEDSHPAQPHVVNDCIVSTNAFCSWCASSHNICLDETETTACYSTYFRFHPCETYALLMQVLVSTQSSFSIAVVQAVTILAQQMLNQFLAHFIDVFCPWKRHLLLPEKDNSHMLYWFTSINYSPWSDLASNLFTTSVTHNYFWRKRVVCRAFFCQHPSFLGYQPNNFLFACSTHDHFISSSCTCEGKSIRTATSYMQLMIPRSTSAGRSTPYQVLSTAHWHSSCLSVGEYNQIPLCC